MRYRESRQHCDLDCRHGVSCSNSKGCKAEDAVALGINEGFHEAARLGKCLSTLRFLIIVHKSDMDEIQVIKPDAPKVAAAADGGTQRTCFVIMPFSETTKDHTEKYW